MIETYRDDWEAIYSASDITIYRRKRDLSQQPIQFEVDLTRTLGWPEPQPRPEPDEARVALTDLGRRALAMERLFGPWPTLAQANAAELPAA